MSILNDYFMMKYDFHKDTIPKYSKVKFITCINDCCLVEDVYTKKRLWVMDYDIYPLTNKKNLNSCGNWSYCEYFDSIAKQYNLSS